MGKGTGGSHLGSSTEGLDVDYSDFSSQPRSLFLRIATAALMLLLPLLPILALLMVLPDEFGAGPLSGFAFENDELFFQACAARGRETGEMPVSGCHDNKAQLIYVLYHLVQGGDGPYDLPAVKLAGLITAGLVVALSALIAYRAYGFAAASIAAALLLMAFAENLSLVAFKTEIVATVFMLASILVLARDRALPGPWFLLLAGLLIGLAFISNQKFAFVGVAVAAWLAVYSSGPMLVRLGGFVWRTTLVAVGALTPFFGLLVYFYFRGQAKDYLATFLLYPLMYGPEQTAPWARQLVWKAADLVSTLSATPLIVMSAVAGALILYADFKRTRSRRESIPLLLILIAALMLLTLLLPPFVFDYHLIPVWSCLVVLGGGFLSGLLSSEGVLVRYRIAISLALIAYAVLVAGDSFKQNAGRGSHSPLWTEQGRVAAEPGDYGYVLGLWPHFYVYNGLIPASDIMFPWALPGAPVDWWYKLPPAGSLKYKLLTELQAENAKRLLRDFEETPPRYILLLPNTGKGGDIHKSNVPGLHEYLAEHCTLVRVIGKGARRGVRGSQIYRCERNPQPRVGWVERSETHPHRVLK